MSERGGGGALPPVRRLVLSDHYRPSGPGIKEILFRRKTFLVLHPTMMLINMKFAHAVPFPSWLLVTT